MVYLIQCILPSIHPTNITVCHSSEQLEIAVMQLENFNSSSVLFLSIRDAWSPKADVPGIWKARKPTYPVNCSKSRVAFLWSRSMKLTEVVSSHSSNNPPLPSRLSDRGWGHALNKSIFYSSTFSHTVRCTKKSKGFVEKIEDKDNQRSPTKLF